MAKYSDIKGFTVQTLSTDTIASQAAGGSWASGGDLNTARRRLLGSGIQTAAIAVAGYSTAAQAIAEQYDGSSWTEVADLNTQRDSGGMTGLAPYAATMYFGGGNSPGGNTGASEQFNGSSWTEVADLNVGRNQAFGVGATSTAALGGGGETPPVVATVEKYDGSSWTEVGDLNTARAFAAGTGSSTAAIVFGGEPPNIANAEQWNGSSWTEVGDLNTGRPSLGGSGATYTSALAFGGKSPVVANTENFDGTSWTEVADLSTARGGGPMGAGTSALSIAAGGNNPGGNLASTEEWSAPADFNQIQEGQLFFNSTANTFKETISDVPGTSWSSGTNLNQARSFNNASGDLTSAITFGGSPAPTQAYSEQWDGSSWTEVGDLNEGRVAGAGGGASGTDAIIAGGYELPNIGNTLNTETWNGSSWTEVNNLNAQKYTAGSGIPVSTSGIAFGGNPVVATAEVWDGTNWTEVGDLNNARMYLGGFGNATSAIAANGVEPPHTQNKVEKWDGSSWTEVAEMNTARGEMLQGQGRTNESGIIAGGSPNGSSQITNTEIWNGSSWSESNDLATARRMGGQIGPTSSGMYIGGQTPSNVVTVEHWESSLTNKTITTS